ncbi:hypothetical protein ACX6XY_24255 [Streptomyces sp. O3]
MRYERDLPAVKHVGFVRNGQVLWPQAGVLPGVTMALLRRHGTHSPDRPLLGTLREAYTGVAAERP